jgi:hypothetical protein
MIIMQFIIPSSLMIIMQFIIPSSLMIIMQFIIPSSLMIIMQFIIPPNVADEWLALLFHNRGGGGVPPGSNLGLETGYSDWFFVEFLSPSIQMLV